MARVTIEDCLKNIENPFEMTVIAAKRAVQISEGALPRVEDEEFSQKNKAVVSALREVAEKKIDLDAVIEVEKSRYENTIY